MSYTNNVEIMKEDNDDMHKKLIHMKMTSVVSRHADPIGQR